MKFKNRPICNELFPMAHDPWSIVHHEIAPKSGSIKVLARVPPV